MLGLAIDNKIVRTFLKTEIDKVKGSYLIELSSEQVDDFESIIFRSMYYTKTIAIINVVTNKEMPNSKIIKNIVEFSKKNDIGVIIMLQNSIMLTKIQNTLKSIGCESSRITVDTIKSNVIRSILIDMYKKSTGKQMSDSMQIKIVNRIRRIHKVDAFLDEVMMQKTSAALHDFMVYKNKVYKGNFAPSIILGNQPYYTSLFIQQNLSNVPYIFTVLLNFVEDLVELYPMYLVGEFCKSTLKDFKPDGEKGKFNKHDVDPLLYLSVLEVKSYEYLYILNQRLKNADTRVKRIVILGEMVL